MSGNIGTTNENQSLSDNTVLYILEKIVHQRLKKSSYSLKIM